MCLCAVDYANSGVTRATGGHVIGPNDISCNREGSSRPRVTATEGYGSHALRRGYLARR